MNKWTRDELVKAFALYCCIPFSKIGYRRPEVISLAKMLGRTPSAVALKLVNFSRLDPELRKRNILGMRHGSKEEERIWNEYLERPSELLENCEKSYSEILLQKVRENYVGEDVERRVKKRKDQGFFRSAVLAAYNYKCCITRLCIPELLVASHIKPWSVDSENRLNPKNGLCLNRLFDEAFDRGLITVDDKCCLKYSGYLKGKIRTSGEMFLQYEGKRIEFPEKFTPDETFLKYHRNQIFVDAL